MCSAARKRRHGRQAAMTLCRSLTARASSCRKFVSTSLNRFVALHILNEHSILKLRMSAFGGKADIANAYAVESSSADELAKFLKADTEKWEAVIKTTGI